MTRVEQDRHTQGLFARDTWQRLLTDTGFAVRTLPYEHSTFEDGPGDVFAGVAR